MASRWQPIVVRIRSRRGHPAGRFRSAGWSDNFWSPLTIFPRRLEGRLSPLKWVDVGGEIGWLGGGADARVGLPALEGRRLAFNLAGGLQTGEVGPFKDTKPQRSRWLRLEFYPLLPIPDWNARLVLAGGVQTGTFYHELSDPRPSTAFTDGIGPDSIQLVRRETRLETSVGLFLRPARGGSILLTVSPYFVVDAGPPQSTCDGCNDLTSYRQGWGIVFVARFGLRYGF